MNHLIDTANKNWLASSGVTGIILTGFNTDTLPQGEQSVHCWSLDSEHIAGPVYRCTAQFIIVTPPHSVEPSVSEQALVNHQAKVSEVFGVINEYNGIYPPDAIWAAEGVSFKGLWVQNEQQSNQDGAWVTTIPTLMGAERIVS